MNLELIKNRIILDDSSILNALKQMSESVKMLFVFHEDAFVSILTIGDIQRAIINNINLNESISNILDYNKIYASIDQNLEVIKEMMNKMRAECMPVLDGCGQLVNVYFWSDLFGPEKEFARNCIDLPVVVMAGGLGSRLRPLTNVIPKPLIPINDKTILEVILDKFRSIGCHKFFISVNYKHDIIEYYMHEKEYDIDYFKEEKPLGTIGSVSLLKGKITTPFFVSNCDNLIDQDLRDVYDYHVSNHNDLTIVTAVKSYVIPYGVIETGDDGVMTNLSEKPELNFRINTGVYILQPELIDEIPQNSFFHITHLMEKIKKNGGKVGCFPISENAWTDIGDWSEYMKIVNRE